MKLRHAYRVGLATLTSLVLFGAAAASAQAAIVDNEWDPFNATVSGDLCGSFQTITFLGKGHVVITYTSDGSGGYSGTVHGNFADVKGTDTNGNTYVFHTQLESAFSSNGASTFNAVGDEAIISQGGSPNDYARVDVHMTVNANGTLTSNTTVDSIGCRG